MSGSPVTHSRSGARPNLRDDDGRAKELFLLSGIRMVLQKFYVGKQICIRSGGLLFLCPILPFTSPDYPYGRVVSGTLVT
jgi:hypothetical protein